MKLAVLLFFSSLAVAQQSATTSAPCSPIAPNNTGTITIKNCYDAVSRDAIVALLKQNQGNAKVTLAKIEECNQRIRSVGEQLNDVLSRSNQIFDAIQTSNLTPQKLLAKYPLGYIIFDVDYRNDVFPYQSRGSLEKYHLDWTNAGLAKTSCPPHLFDGQAPCDESNFITIRLPDFGRFHSPLIGGPKRLGRMSRGHDVVLGNDATIDVEILAIRSDGIVFLMGMAPLP